MVAGRSPTRSFSNLHLTGSGAAILALDGGVVMPAVAVGAGAETDAEEFVEVAEVFEAAGGDDVEDRAFGGAELAGGVGEAGLVDDGGGGTVEVAAGGAGEVLGGATGKAGKLPGTQGEVARLLDTVERTGEPSGEAVGLAAGGEGGEQGDNAAQEGVGREQVAGAGVEVAGEEAQAVEIGGVERPLAAAVVFFGEIDRAAGEVGLPQVAPEGAGEGEVDEAQGGAGLGDGEAVGVIGPDEHEQAGGEGAGLAVDPVEAGAFLDPEEFVVVVGVEVGGVGGVRVLPVREGAGVTGGQVGEVEAAHHYNVIYGKSCRGQGGLNLIRWRSYFVTSPLKKLISFMSSKTFRVGLIGTGGIAQGVHIPGWKALPDVEIVAVADSHEPTARKAAAMIDPAGGVQVFTGWSELLRLDLDAVDICTPNKAHTPAVLAALGAGKHVLCEKPLATTSDEVRAMGGAAAAAGRVLCTVQNNRYRAETQAIKRWAEGGGLGDVYHARVRAMRRTLLPPRPGFIDETLSGGGPCMDIGVHALDAALWVMGFPAPTRVSGTTKVNFAKGHKIPGKWGEWDREQFSVEDFAAGFIHFANGATMTLEAAWLGHQKEDEDFSFQLFGSEGGVHWPSAEIATARDGVLVDGKLSWPRRVEKTHGEQIAAFYEACRQGGPSPVPWEETVQVITILEAIYASQRAGREVVIG